MKKYFLFLLIASIAFVSCSKNDEDETQIKTSSHASALGEQVTGAYYMVNNYCFYFYTSNYSLKNGSEYNLWEVSYDGEKYKTIPTGNITTWDVVCYHQTNSYNTLWKMENNPHDFDGSMTVTKNGENYSVTLKTGVLYDSDDATAPSRTITYTGPIELITMLEY